MILFVAGLGHASSKKRRVEIVIGEMDISRLMTYMQQIEEGKLIDREVYINKKSKTGMSLVNRMVVQDDHNLINQRGMHHHLLVDLRPETYVSIMAKINRSSMLDQPSPR